MTQKLVSIKTQKCPICLDKMVIKFYPFCSQRCGEVDLGRWLNGIYRIPVEERTPTDYNSLEEDYE